MKEKQIYFGGSSPLLTIEMDDEQAAEFDRTEKQKTLLTRKAYERFMEEEGIDESTAGPKLARERMQRTGQSDKADRAAALAKLQAENQKKAQVNAARTGRGWL
jgi:hypothetical protein